MKILLFEESQSQLVTDGRGKISQAVLFKNRVRMVVGEQPLLSPVQHANPPPRKKPFLILFLNSATRLIFPCPSVSISPQKGRIFLVIS